MIYTTSQKTVYRTSDGVEHKTEAIAVAHFVDHRLREILTKEYHNHRDHRDIYHFVRDLLENVDEVCDLLTLVKEEKKKR